MDLITASEAPAAIGPYSHAVVRNGLAYCSGALPLDPESMTLVEGIEAQSEQVLKNMAAVLSASGSSLAQVVKTTIFLANMADFPVVNGIYAEAFGDHKPARSTVQVAALPLGASIEIECIAEVE
ncbi:MAG: Rid family detoxifying hydrolase [Verrucomicrobiota bacterium]|nr:Rid family detoxifying hydrolase [Verrucomicrobiota bacterium]